MKNPFLLFILLLSFGAEEVYSSAPLPIALAVGSTKQIPASMNQEVRVGNGRIVKVEDRGSSITVTGKKIGATEVRIGNRAYLIQVSSRKSYEIAMKFEDLLKEIKGLTLNWSEAIPTIDGELLRFEDWMSIAGLAGQSSYEFRAKLSADSELDALTHFNKILSQSKLPTPSLTLDSGARLRIPNAQGFLKKSYERLFGPFGFKIELDEKLVSLEPMVEVTILVAEVRRKSFTRLGIQWPTSVSAKIVPKPEIASSIEIALQTLEEKGLGKVLASPKILCRSGKEAQFLAGGEFPIKIMNYKVNDVVWKKHGVLLKIKPQVDLEGRMSIALETEVSMIDTSQVVDGIPGLLTNRIESHFDLERTETIALSGLIKKEWGKSQTGLPGLTSLPVLGRLFSSEDYRENRTELVVFVTPRVVPVKGIGQQTQMPESWNDTH